MITKERASEDASVLLNSCGIDRIEHVRRGSLRPNGRMDYHLLYIASGECRVVIGGKTHVVKEGGIILYLPGERQEYYFEPDRHSVSYYIHFTGRDVFSILRSLGFVGKNIYEAEKNPALEEIFLQMHREYSLLRVAHEQITSGLLLALLGIASRVVCRGEMPVDEKKQAQVERAIERMYADIDKKLPVEALARECNYSVGYFAHLFSSVVGLSPHAYMNRLRIERAKSMLLHTESTVLEIALAVGCQDQNYFSRFFKEQTGLSPTAYRDHWRKTD